METQGTERGNKAKIRFKSYYVVWKPRILQSTSSRRQKFKSYYVVWKPPENEKYEKAMCSLNRTM